MSYHSKELLKFVTEFLTFTAFIAGLGIWLFFFYAMIGA